MTIDHPTMTTSSRPRAAAGWVSAVVAVALLAAACGDDSDAVSAADGSASEETTTTTAAEPTVEPTVVETAADEELATTALLGAGDLDGWEAGPEEYVFPNDVELARTVPACAEVAELVFAGGSAHGAGVSGVLSRDADLLFTYVVVFPTEEDAAAMVAATADPAFDDCWAGFNEVAVPEMPIGADSASYQPEEPPDLSIDADNYDVEYLTGSIDLDGTGVSDTCVCVFAQSGRGVVEVHSTEPTMDVEERAAAVQVAVDKLTETLG